MPNGKPYLPWHDSTMLLAGPVGAALADLGNERWRRATKQELRDVRGDGAGWPDDLEPDFKGVDVAISRTRVWICSGVSRMRSRSWMTPVTGDDMGQKRA